MRVLLDEDVPVQALQVLKHVCSRHQVCHAQEMGWNGKKDLIVYRDAAKAGFEVIVTNDGAQMEDPDETTAVKRSGMHRISYPHRHPGLKGLAVAVAGLVSAIPCILEELENADGQRLVTITGIDPTPTKRYKITDPRRHPPKYWPR